MRTIDISSSKDLSDLFDAIISGEKVQVGDVKPIPFVLHFKGEKFKVKDGYISAEFADFLSTFRKDYKLFLENTFGKSKVEDVEVLFKVEDGSIELDMLNDLPAEVWGVIGKMDGLQVTTLGIIALLGFFGTKAWKDYLDTQKHKIETTEANETNKKALEVATKAIEELGRKPVLEKAKNRAMKEAIGLLGVGDTLELSDGTLSTYDMNDVETFNYVEVYEPKETIIEDTYTIKGFDKINDGWRVKLRSQLLNTFVAVSLLDQRDNAKLYQAADDGEDIALKVRVVREGKTIKEAYILPN
ncbi:MAG TPA: hypothetical protein CFH81_00310 [Sulfurovum sp. UBA12169]|nr:MAG TPA: hypothetical protein CFH81_00310 [Sulfurovum sp. UBA12169]